MFKKLLFVFIALVMQFSAAFAQNLVMDFSFDNGYENLADGTMGTALGDRQYGKGVLGNAVYLDGDGDYISLGRGYNLSKNFTMNVWVNPDTENEYRQDAAILAKYETNLYGPYDFYLSNNRPAFWVSDGNGSYESHISNTVLESNKWGMLTYTYDYKKSQLTIYINGKYDTSFNCIPVTSNSDEVTIGRQSLMFGDYSRLQYRGWIDELRVYNETLSENDVKLLYQSYAGQKTIMPSSKFKNGNKKFRSR